jgi:excisionase family DNA binding protein
VTVIKRPCNRGAAESTLHRQVLGFDEQTSVLLQDFWLEGYVAEQADIECTQLRALTERQVAERLGVSRFTVRAWRRKGLGPRFMKMGRVVRYRLEDVQEYERHVLVGAVE